MSRTIKRGPPPKRSAKRAPKKQPPLDRLLAKLPFSPEALAKAATWTIMGVEWSGRLAKQAAPTQGWGSDVRAAKAGAQAANVANAQSNAPLHGASDRGVHSVTFKGPFGRVPVVRDAQAAWTNCICVPASSITSPFFSGMASPDTGAPLTVGRVAPSTCANT